MALTAEQKALCAAWVTSPNRTWQTLNRSQWKYQFREKTLVRYVEEAKMDEDIVPLLLEYLTSDDCKATLQLYGQGVDPEWTPTRAWYEISNKSAGAVRSVRLYHGIAIEPTNGEDGPYLIEDGCAYRVSWTYYWKRESVQQAPQSISGISYRVVNLQRDSETGLFNYAIEKRERVQQDIEEYLMKTTQFEDVSEEVHLGVRGDLAAGGKQASVANGKTVTRKVTKNADCTHDVHNTITQDKAVPEAEVTVAVGVRGTSVTKVNRNMAAPAPTTGLAPGESVRNQKTDSKLWNQTIRTFLRDALVWLRGTCRKTIFAHSHSETTNVKDNPGFSHAVDAANGVVHEISVHKTEEGYDVTDAVTEEKPVSNASESVHVGLDGTTRTVTHRNQRSKAPAPTEIGETVTNEKTQGGLWNQSIRSIVRTAFLKLGEACSKTIFSHSHSTTTMQGSDPGFAHVEEAGGGVVRRKNVTRTENGYRIESSETTEKPVGKASVEYRKTLHGTRVTKTDRNQGGPLGGGGMEVGDVRSSRKTEGGRYDNTVSTLTVEPGGKIAESKSDTQFSKSHVKTENLGKRDSVEVDVESAGDGVTHRKSQRMNEDGTVDETAEDTTEKEVGKARETKRMTLEGLVRQTTDMNASNADNDTPDKIGKSITNEKTPGKRYNVTRTDPPSKGAGIIRDTCVNTHFEHRHSKTTNKEPGDLDAETGFEKGKIVHVSQAYTGSGTVNETKDVITPKFREHRYDFVDPYTGAHHYVYEYRNSQTKLINSISLPGEAYNVHKHDEVTAAELHNGYVRYTVGGRYGGASSELKFNKHGATQTYYDVARDPRSRIWKHRKWQVKVRHIRGDAYTDYIAEQMRANPKRKTAGTMGVRLISSYQDRDGNLLAEWVQVDLVGDVGQQNNWVICDRNCDHAKDLVWDEWSAVDTVNQLLNNN